MQRHGKTPAVYLAEQGMFEYGGGGVPFRTLYRRRYKGAEREGGKRCQLSCQQLEVGKRHRSVKKYSDSGLNIALGTDGPASNNCLDMFREMFLVTGLAKLREEDASAVDAWEVLKMATVNGARAMYLPDSDVLAPGKAADIIMIDLQQPNMQPINNIPKNLVYSGSKQNVKMTMIQGRILYENGIFTDAYDVEEIYRKANEIIDSLR